LFERGGILTTQDDVELVPQRPVITGLVVVKHRDHALAFALRNRVEDRILEEHWIIREVHLGDESLTKLATVEREVNVRGAPCIVVVTPRVCARLDRIKAVVTLSIRQAAGHTIKVRIKWSRPRVIFMAVTSSGVLLPSLNQRISNGLVVPASHLSVNQDTLSDCFAAVDQSHIVI